MLLCFGKAKYFAIHFLLNFSSKNSFRKGNGILFARSDHRSEVVMCMEWAIVNEA